MTMNNRIRKSTVDVRRLSAAEAEVWVTVEVEELTPGTELRGKLTGPRCPGVTTVEVAYPLRPLRRPAEEWANALLVRVLIPEPNLWTEGTPFVYDGRLELWQDGKCVDMAKLVVGLKQAG
jgi:hypothetical protein